MAELPFLTFHISPSTSRFRGATHTILPNLRTLGNLTVKSVAPAHTIWQYRVARARHLKMKHVRTVDRTTEGEIKIAPTNDVGSIPTIV